MGLRTVPAPLPAPLNVVERVALLAPGIVALCLSGCSTGALSRSGGTVEFDEIGRIPVWIDTDPSVGEKDRDVDDGLALIQAFHSRELQVAGVSTVFGNVPQDRAYPIARSLIESFGPKGLGCFRGARSAADLGLETEATRALEAALRARRLLILALGPLTNVATVLIKHPELRANVAQVVAVAGRRPGQRFVTGRINRRGHRDLNFELDPRAFQAVLDSGVALTLAPFELSSTLWITPADVAALEKGGRAARWIAGPARAWGELWQRTFAVDGFNPFDMLAVAFAVSPQMLKCDVLPVAIRVSADDRTEPGMQGFVTDEKPYLLVSADIGSGRMARYCHDADPMLKHNLLERLLMEGPMAE